MHSETLKLRHLRTFLEVARVQSVSLAAQTLHVTQPAVSRSLRELEQMLGTALFDRVGRGLRLNEAGRVYQSHAAASLLELERGRERLTKQAGVTTRLSVGALPTASADLLPRAALAFQAQHPHVRTHILTGPNWLLFNQLREGAVDLVVGRMPEKSVATGVTFQQLYLEDVVVIARPGHPILTAETAERRLDQYPLILPPSGAVIADTVARYLSSIGLPELRGTWETVALPVGRKIVALSDALWFISRGVVADEIAARQLVPVAMASPILSGPVGISMPRSAVVSTARSAFVDCLRTAAQA